MSNTSIQSLIASAISAAAGFDNDMTVRLYGLESETVLLSAESVAAAGGIYQHVAEIIEDRFSDDEAFAAEWTKQIEDHDYDVLDTENQIAALFVSRLGGFDVCGSCEAMELIDSGMSEDIVIAGINCEIPVYKIEDAFFCQLDREDDQLLGEYCADNGFIEIPDHLMNYFDFAAYGHDVAFDLSCDNGIYFLNNY